MFPVFWVLKKKKKYFFYLCLGKGKWNGAYYYYFSKTDKQLAVDKLFSVKLEHLMNFLSSHEVLIRPYKQQLKPQSQSHRRGHRLATWQHQTV